MLVPRVVLARRLSRLAARLAGILLLLAALPAATQDFSRTPRAGLLEGRGIGPQGADRRCGTADDFDGIANTPDLRGPDGMCGTADDLRIFFFGTAQGRGRGGCFTANPDVANCAGDSGAKSAEWSLTQVVDLAACLVTSTLTNTSNGEPGCPNRGCINAWNSPRLPNLQTAVRAALDVAPGISVSAVDGPGAPPCRIVQAPYRMGWNPETDRSPHIFLGGPFDGCGGAGEPAASLLLPWFRVDLASASGVTTTLAIHNATAGDRLARMVLWTDWGVPTLTFYVPLTGADVLTLNLRDVFAGRLPMTPATPADRAAPPLLDVECPPEWLAPAFGPDELAALRADHTGVGNPATGDCAGTDYGDSIARGYATLDVIEQCDYPPTVATYAEEGFVPAPRRPADGDPNSLWGDWFEIEPGNDFAQGERLVDLAHDPARFAEGSQTFYGRYDGFGGSDATRPLASRYASRYLAGGPFDGGTRLRIWRDNLQAGFERAACGSDPSWYPLGTTRVAVFDEEENGVLLTGGLSQLCDGPVGGVAFECPVVSPFPAGVVAIDFAPAPDQPAQAWLGARMSARGRFSVAQPGVPLDDPCGERGLAPAGASPP